MKRGTVDSLHSLFVAQSGTPTNHIGWILSLRENDANERKCVAFGNGQVSGGGGASVMDDAAVERVARAFDGRPGVTRGRAFASDSLMVNGKIFVMFHQDGMVFKLPVEGCQELVAEDLGALFTVGKRVMKEWIVVPEEHADRWVPLADEAYEFVMQESEER
jgi:hypothetical protein